MTGILNALIAGVSGAVKDTYFNLVSLLLPGNGTNGATNNSFVDSSTANSGTGWPITRNGDTTQGTFSPFSQTGWGAYFDGSNDYVACGAPLTNSVFTLSLWFYPLSSSVTGLFDSGPGLVSAFRNNPANTIEDQNGGSVAFSSNVNAWNWLCITANGTNFSVYVNGTLQGTAAYASLANTNFTIGAINQNTGFFNGYISGFEIINGASTAIPVPTSPRTASGKQLLALQSNRFVDQTGNFTLTPTNGVAITPFSPFAPTSSYSAAAVGGSGYFDGSGDYLSIADNAAFDFGSGAFTVEAWFYRTGGGNRTGQTVYSQSASGASSNSALFFGAGNDGVSLYLSTSGSAWTNNIETGVAPTLNAWSHVVWQRNGNTLEIYLNGALQTVVSGSAAFSGTIFNSSRDVEIGIQQSTQGPLFGNLCNLRVVKGATVYTGNFTPPTKPLAASGADSAGSYPSTTNVNTSFASSATSLLLNFTNAGVVDATAKNVLETEGNAQISTSVSKWPGGSIYLDGTANTAVKLLTGNQLSPFSGDYTYECWVYFNSFTGVPVIFDTRASNGAVPGLQLSCSTGGVLTLYGGASTATLLITGGTLSTGQWYYVALVRSGSGSNNTKLYLNGSQSGSSATDTTNYNNQGGYIGAGASGTSNYVNGYIDDFRFTRYARTITASPTAPFPVQ
jgi:hypothetical protein